MTVESTVNRVDYVATAGQTDFGFSFKYFVATDIEVYVAGVEQTTGFTVTPSAQGVAFGGTVAFATGLTVGQQVAILRRIPITQESDYEEGDRLPAQQVEDDFDRGAMVNQQQQEDLRRRPALSTDSLVTDVIIQDPETAIAGHGLVWRFNTTSNLWELQATTRNVDQAVDDLDQAVADVEADRVRAETAATNAEASETAAATSETNAATSATNAATSATNAATSATNAGTSETNAGNSATAAAGSATAAANSATAAATSETNAGTSETNAGNSATAAATSATNAATSATNAATSETNAATSETNAATSATNSANSATAAAQSAAGVNLPAIESGDANQLLSVNAGETGYELGKYLEHRCIIRGATTSAPNEVQDTNLGNATGTIAARSRYVLTNPFGENIPVIAIVEVLINSVWTRPGFIFVSNVGQGLGTEANYVQGVGIVVQTGTNAIATSSVNSGNGSGIVGNVTSARARVQVFRVEV